MSDQPLELAPGREVRVSLYWEALDAPGAERTVSVRILGPSGALIAQQDNWPGRGKKPTSWWRKGWQIRDVYYLAVPEGAEPGRGQLSIIVYDSYNTEIVPFNDGMESLMLREVIILPARGG
jgi:hypothetical protein